MDKIYTKSYLKDFLNKVYSTNLDNQQMVSFLSQLVTEQNNHFEDSENNYLIMLILTCINKNDLTYQNKMLINEIINSLLLDQLEENGKTVNTCDTCEDTAYMDYFSDENNEDLKDLDLEDNEAVKAYFLKKNKHLDNSGNFPYPQKGKTAVIRSGDNMTIPGIRYIINYIIDYKGDVLGIQGYPKRELSQEGYEQVYSDLVDSIFKD